MLDVGGPGTVPPERSQVAPVAGAVPGPLPAAQPSGMPNWVRPYAGLVAVSVLIWAITSVASGELLYFWPVWMLFPLIFAAVVYWLLTITFSTGQEWLERRMRESDRRT